MCETSLEVATTCVSGAPTSCVHLNWPGCPLYIADMSTAQIGRCEIFYLLSLTDIAFRSLKVMLSEGAARSGWPMGFLPASDSTMHAAWLVGSTADLLIECEEHVSRNGERTH